jgi:hypothetical membrane protein
MRKREARLIRALARLSIAGQLVWVGLVSLGGLIEPGYSEVVQAVSELGARDAERPWLFGVAVAIWGASFIAAAVALQLDGPGGPSGWVGPALIGLTGIAQLLEGFPLPLDCQPTIDIACEASETAAGLSLQHYAHVWVYLVGALALLLSVFAMAWRFRGDERWGRADLLAISAGIAGVAILVVLFFIDSEGHYGVVQRLSLAAGGVWVGSLTIGLLAIHGRPGEAAYRVIAWVRELPGGKLVPRPGVGSSGHG